METSLKSKILDLRSQSFGYNEIAALLNCSKATVCYHCQIAGVNNIGLRKVKLSDNEIDAIKKYYLNNSIIDTANYFGISETTVKKYVDLKRVLLTETEKNEHNYAGVKYYRQRLKLRAIEYKGGKCIKCGYDKCVRSMQFHHRNPAEKDFTIGSYANLGWNKIKMELDKCDLLCSNCHGELHEEIDNKK